MKERMNRLARKDKESVESRLEKEGKGEQKQEVRQAPGEVVENIQKQAETQTLHRSRGAMADARSCRARHCNWYGDGLAA